MIQTYGLDNATGKSDCSFLVFSRLFLILLPFIINCSLLFGVDLNIRPCGFVFIPAEVESAGGNVMYNVGGGGGVTLKLIFQVSGPTR